MVSKSARRRALARAHWERQQGKRLAAANKRRRQQRAGMAAVLSLALVFGLGGTAFWLTRGGGDLSTLEDDVAGSQCTYVPDSSSQDAADLPPGTPIAPPATKATITLDGKPVVVELEPEAAPCTVNSLQFLADNDFYDDTICPRLTGSPTLSVLQCGTPDGTQSGGPGYTYAEENLDGATYTAGTVAMAKTAVPATTGSQFFLVYEDSQLPPEYTVVGNITSGLDVIKAIAKRGNAADGVAPKTEVSLTDLVLSTE